MAEDAGAARPVQTSQHRHLHGELHAVSRSQLQDYEHGFPCLAESFAGDELTDEQLRDIAREYMERMGYGNQPYIVFKHKDISREHLHIVSLRVDENGRKISDSHEYDRSMSVLRRLERKYGLHLAPGKDSVQRERLREPDKTKYEIYDAIKGWLPKCKSWNDLEDRLKEQGINVHYKYCGNTDRKQGVLFSKNDFEFRGRRSTDNSASRN